MNSNKAWYWPGVRPWACINRTVILPLWSMAALHTAQCVLLRAGVKCNSQILHGVQAVVGVLGDVDEY